MIDPGGLTPQQDQEAQNAVNTQQTYAGAVNKANSSPPTFWSVLRDTALSALVTELPGAVSEAGGNVSTVAGGGVTLISGAGALANGLVLIVARGNKPTRYHPEPN